MGPNVVLDDSIQDLRRRTRAFFDDNFSQLGSSQFHYASRLFLWHKDSWAAQQLALIKPKIISDGSRPGLLECLKGFLADKGSVKFLHKASGLREPYFKKYPRLIRANLLMARLNFSQAIYGIKEADIMGEFFGHNELEDLFRKLIVDEPAIAWLSTHAINFIYLLKRFVQPDERLPDLREIEKIGRSIYDEDDELQLRLKLYLWNHCIIGETIFYTRLVPEAKLTEYRNLLAATEESLANNFNEVTLDVKFEFLVCARICLVSTRLEKKIYAEAAQSLAPELRYIIEPRHALGSWQNTIKGSEHRNILFLMSCSNFDPAGSPI